MSEAEPQAQTITSYKYSSKNPDPSHIEFRLHCCKGKSLLPFHSHQTSMHLRDWLWKSNFSKCQKRLEPDVCIQQIEWRWGAVQPNPVTGMYVIRISGHNSLIVPLSWYLLPNARQCFALCSFSFSHFAQPPWFSLLCFSLSHSPLSSLLLKTNDKKLNVPVTLCSAYTTDVLHRCLFSSYIKPTL